MSCPLRRRRNPRGSDERARRLERLSVGGDQQAKQALVAELARQGVPQAMLVQEILALGLHAELIERDTVPISGGRWVWFPVGLRSLHGDMFAKRPMGIAIFAPDDSRENDTWTAEFLTLEGPADDLRWTRSGVWLYLGRLAEPSTTPQQLARWLQAAWGVSQHEEHCPRMNPRGDDRLRRAQRYGDSDPKLEAWRRGLAVPPDDLSERGGWARWVRPDGRVVIADFTPGVWSVLPPIGMQDVDWEIELRPEDVAPEDMWGHEDKEPLEWIHERLRAGNDWAWCVVRVVARWGGQEGDDYLGGCSYEDEKEFRQGGYYEDMQRRAFDSLLDNLDVAQATADGEELAFGTEDELQGRERWWLDPVVQEAVFESYSMRMPGQNPGGSRGDARMRELERKAALGDQEALAALRAMQARVPDGCSVCGSTEGLVRSKGSDGSPEWVCSEHAVPESFVLGYLNCLLWTGTAYQACEECNGEGPANCEECYGAGHIEASSADAHLEVEDLSPEVVQEARNDCQDFYLANYDLLQQALELGRDDSDLGHDFCLSRNGHGAGFFDRGPEPVWGQLQDASRPYGTQQLDVLLDQDGEVAEVYLHG